MKVPTRSELRKLNTTLAKNADGVYRRILREVAVQWTTISNDNSLEQAIRSWDVPRMIELSDVLVHAVHSTVSQHFAAHQIAALIRKYPWTESQSKMDPEQAAIRTFLLSEHRCKRMNQFFVARRRRRGKPAPGAAVFERMRSWVRYVISDEPDLRSIYSKCDLTGGASIGVHGNATNLARKLLADEGTVGPCARPYVAAALCHNFHFATRVAKRRSGIQCLEVTEEDLGHASSMVSYNKIAFVPKTAKTHRSIAVEPLWNSFIQKGTDVFLRQRLKRVGLDLSDQSLNQEMAREGSLDEEDSFVTIDLSSASDSISIEVVRELLPPDWFRFLNCIRSPSYEYNGSVTRYQKFVTMGNGFCFPLQTLLFAAVVKACSPQAQAPRDFRVYGDDIICRKSIATQVVETLKLMGFRTNRKKTYLSGPFRESCGGNWYRGEDVSPMTLDYKLDSLENIFKFLNGSNRNLRSAVFLSEARAYVLRTLPDLTPFHRPVIGRPETAINPDPFVVRSKAPGWNKNLQAPCWYELHSTAVIDRVDGGPDFGWVLMAAALRGSSSEAPFTLRRSVSTRIRRVVSAADEAVDHYWSMHGGLIHLASPG